MKKHTITIFTLFCVVMLLSLVAASLAQDPKEGIKTRMKDRFPKISELKQSGKIGETPAGFAEAVTPKAAADQGISKLLADENADRKLLYNIIAQESGTSAEEVGMGNAQRYFQKASGSDYFKTRSGEWKQKKDMVP